MNSLQRRPSLAQRLALFREAVRGIWQGPIYTGDPKLREFFGGTPSSSTGISVSEDTALNYSAVWSAINCISGDIAALPLHMYRRVPGGGKEKFIGNPLYRVIHDQPNPEMTSIAWRRTIQAHVLSWGNGYSEIVRDGSGRASQLWPITPDRVSPFRRGIDSPLEYRIVNRDGSDSFIPASDMLHIPGLGFDGTQGYGVICKARESIGLGLATERFGGTFFGNGSTFGGVLSFKGPKPPESSEKNFREMLNSQHQGVDKAHKFLALYNEASYTQIGIPPNAAQFLETRKFQISEIARWFNLPPHKLGDLERATFSNIEQQTIDYYTGTLLPWLEGWEQELFSKLVPNSERNIQFFEHTVDGLLRGDSQMRADSFSKRFSTGSITPNEIRDSENQNPITGGEMAFAPLNMIPLELAKDWFQADIDEKKAKAEQARRPPPAPVATPQPTPDPNKVREIELLTEARDTARRCAQEAEDAKDILAADLVKLQAEWAHARAEWETTQAELATTLATRDASITDLTNSLADREQVLKDCERREADGVLSIERLTAQATSLGTDLATATRDLSAAKSMASIIEADYQRVCQEKSELVTVDDEALARTVSLESERDALTSRVESLSADVAIAMTERTSACERIVELEADVQRSTEAFAQAEDAHQAAMMALRGELDMLTQEHATATAHLLDARAQIVAVDVAHKFDRGAWEADVQRLTSERTQADEVNAATVTELRSQVTTISQDLSASTAALLEAQTVIGKLEATRAIDQATLAENQLALSTYADTLQHERTRLAETQQAIRGTVVDVADRLIARESERARKSQGTTDKLGKWVETFYPIHEDFCRMALKPAVRAVLVAYGSDAPLDRVLDRIVLAHVSESSRQLQGVLQDADSESLAPALERVLRRWESERAEALADRILKEAS